MFNEDYVTFPRDTIGKITGLAMPVNKRNWQKQREHLEEARMLRDLRMKRQGRVWWNSDGRPTAQSMVFEWRRQHPESRKADCRRDTGLDPKTIRKWWDCPPPSLCFRDGHITVPVEPSKEVSDFLVAALAGDEPS